MPGNEYGGNNSTSPKCGKWSIFANQVTIGCKFVIYDHILPCIPSDDTFLGTTPANRPDSPEYIKPPRSGTPPNLMSLHDEHSVDIEDSGEEGEGRSVLHVHVCIHLIIRESILGLRGRRGKVRIVHV